jgi:CheY-like chemotaxis protein
MADDAFAGRGTGLAGAAGPSEAGAWPAGDASPHVIRLDRHRPRLPAEGTGGAALAGCDADRAIRVLVVSADAEDHPIVQELLARAEHRRFEVERAGDAATGLERLAAGRHDIALVECRSSDDDGLGLIQEAARRGLELPMIALCGLATPELDLAAIAAGAADVLEKEELEIGRLERAIRLALARSSRREPPLPCPA